MVEVAGMDVYGVRVGLGDPTKDTPGGSSGEEEGACPKRNETQKDPIFYYTSHLYRTLGFTKRFTEIISFYFSNKLLAGISYFHLLSEKTEVQKGSMTSPRLHD